MEVEDQPDSSGGISKDMVPCGGKTLNGHRHVGVVTGQARDQLGQGLVERLGMFFGIVDSRKYALVHG
jgi:hypothetical protein